MGSDPIVVTYSNFMRDSKRKEHFNENFCF